MRYNYHMPKVSCYFCGKIFFKSTGRFNEAKKLKWNFYCSKNCQTEILKKRISLVCENQKCGKRFERLRSGVSKHNFCSQSCAAVFNNCKRFANHFKICRMCRSKYKGENFYCSLKCAKEGRRGYTAKDLLKEVQLLAKAYRRVPARREAKLVADRCRRIFGSWNNAIKLIGLQPNRSHESRMYKRTMTKANDGHLCDSISEAIIDNWFAERGILHKRDAKYPTSGHKADWKVENSFVEYFGLAKDSPRYDRAIKKKLFLTKKQNMKLIAIYPNDLYPVNRLDEKLNSFL